MVCYIDSFGQDDRQLGSWASSLCKQQLRKPAVTQNSALLIRMWQKDWPCRENFPGGLHYGLFMTNLNTKGAYSGVNCEQHITVRTELKGLKQGVHRCQEIDHCLLHHLLREFGILPSFKKLRSGRSQHISTWWLRRKTYNLLSSK